LGTSTFLTDANGNSHQFFLNLPFGETMAEQLPSSSYTSPYKFNGKELDAETGLYYYGARYYDPKSSIWFSVDPLAEKLQGWSPYNFVRNNPINRIDPDGRTDFLINGEKRTINDGNDNLTVRNVSQRQFNRLERKFENGKTPNYNRLLNKVTQKNGYQVSRVITPSWGYSSEYSVEFTSYGKNNKTPYSKHEHRGFYNFAQGLQDSGNKASMVGYGLTLSVVGAEAGIPLATYGGISSGIGAGLQIGMDLYTGNYEEAGKNTAFAVGGAVINKGVGKYLDKNMTGEGSELGKEIIQQGVGLKIDLATKAIDKKIAE
jgi:RHS repeat-associated protein